ncbi:glycosyltransferase [Coleofasciculus sp. F4-SAH-05]|uniref:glycosyltransferase n=1 Tax=Coleofasciculus sp. F4-SAH-05 TaxID=3069525 RepID=UPI0032F0F9D1
MRTAFLVGEFPSLSETFILNQITGLIDRGCHVDIYATKPKKEGKIHPDVEKHNLLSHTYYYPQIPDSYLRRVWKAIGLFLSNFFKDPILLWRSLNWFKYKKKATSLRLLYTVIPFLGKRPDYDIIQCHFGSEGLKGMDLRDMGAIKGKLCTIFHGLDLSGHLKKYGDSLYDQLFETGDIFMPISNNWKNQLIQLGCDQQRIIVHRMGIDCQQFTFTPRHPDPDGSIRLVSIARLVEKKGIEYGIRAVAQLSQSYSHIQYNIIGDGELRESLEQLIKELNAGEQIKLLGWKQKEEVITILNNSHILLAPSITGQNGDQEGIPVVLMEAMAMGLPVISTYHSGIPELVEDGVTGFLVPEKNYHELAGKIKILVEAHQLWTKIGQTSRLRVENDYDINHLNDKLIKKYKSLV